MGDAEIAAAALADARRGDADSQCYVAIGLTYGSDGFEKNEAAAAALRWFRQAAAQGNRQALCNLGFLYQFGIGVPADPVEAERLYRRAATRGHPEALEALDSSDPECWG